MVPNVMRQLRESPRYKWWVGLAISIGILVDVSHFGAVTVVQPFIGDNFDAGLLAVQWVIVGYMLSVSAFLLPMGRLSDLVGRKRVYIIGLAIFSIGSVISGFSDTLALLIVFRIIQGIGPAMTIGNQMAILTSVFPLDERGRAVGLHMTMVGMGLVMGPTLGGFLSDIFGWRAVFFIYGPLGLISLIPAIWILHDNREERVITERAGSRFDLVGAVLSAVSLVAFLLAMTNGPNLGWSSPLIIVLLVAWVVVVCALLFWELKFPFPILDLKLFRSQLFSIGVITRSLNMTTWVAPLFLMPFYLQGVVGYSARDTGLVMTAMVVATAALAPIVGRLSDRFGTRAFTLSGSILATTALFLLANISTSTPIVLLVAFLVMHSSAYTLFNVPNSTSIFNAVGLKDHGVIGAFLQLLRNVFVVTGIALATVIVAGTMDAHGLHPSLEIGSKSVATAESRAFVEGMRNAFLVMGSLQGLAIILLVIKPESGKSRRGQNSHA